MFGQRPKLPIISLFDTPVQETSSKTAKEYIADPKNRMKSAQEMANRMTEKAILKNHHNRKKLKLLNSVQVLRIS